MDLEAALNQFDQVEINLRRLEDVWEKLTELIPAGVVFSSSGQDANAYAELQRAFDEILKGIPAIDGWKIADRPLDFNEIAQRRLDANEVGTVEMHVANEAEINAPASELAEYRFKFTQAKRELVRDRVRELSEVVDAATAAIIETLERNQESVAANPTWLELKAAIAEIERLVGSSVQRKGRWNDLNRHLSFALHVDALDIAEFDWPSVKVDIERALYNETEPVPVDTEDLGALVKSRPEGSVTTELAWSEIDEDVFERLIYNIIGDTEGYENAQWLTKTNAPDRGRDLSVDRVLIDPLGGIKRHRVIVQCKHWQSRSVRDVDISDAIVSMAHWEPPPVDVLVFAASGRFTSDAIAWAEKRNQEGHRLSIELWPETHLESLLAERPHLVREFGLRPDH